MLAIAGGKGGCGKTTTTLGLAAALDGRVTAVDADTDMPNLHAMAEVPREPPRNRVGHVYPADESVAVRPAPTRTDDPRSDGRGDGRTATRRIERIREATRGATLVDCPAGAGPDAAAPLRAADAALLVTPPCAPALRDTAKTAAMAEAVGTAVLGAVLVRSRLVPDGVASLLDCPVLGAIPPADPPVLDAEPVRRAYRNVAADLQASKEL